MRRAKQITGTLMVGITAFIVSTGCISESASSSTSQAETGKDSRAGSGVSAASGGQITLRFTWWGEDERNETTLAVIDQYQKLHPEVRIEAEMDSDQGYIDKVSAMLVNSTALNILQQNVDFLLDFVPKGDFFVDFYEYKDILNTPGPGEAFISQFGTFDGESLVLLTGMSCLTIVANKNAAKTCSVDLTRQITWDPMLEDRKELHAENPDYYYINTDIKVPCEYVLRLYLRQMTGESLIIDSGKKMNFIRDQLVEVLTYTKGCYDGGVFEPAEDSATFKGQIHTNPKWIGGKLVSACGPSSSINLLMDVVPEAGCIVAQIPITKGRINDGFLADTPQYTTVSRSSEHVREAVDSLNYFRNSAEVQETFKGARSIPPTSVARQPCADKGLLNQTAVDAIDLAVGLNNRSDKRYIASAEVYMIQEDMMESIVYGRSTPEEVADNVTELINDYPSGLHQKVSESNIKEIGRRSGYLFPGRLKDRGGIGR